MLKVLLRVCFKFRLLIYLTVYSFQSLIYFWLVCFHLIQCTNNFIQFFSMNNTWITQLIKTLKANFKVLSKIKHTFFLNGHITFTMIHSIFWLQIRIKVTKKKNQTVWVTFSVCQNIRHVVTFDTRGKSRHTFIINHKKFTHKKF